MIADFLKQLNIQTAIFVSIVLILFYCLQIYFTNKKKFRDNLGGFTIVGMQGFGLVSGLKIIGITIVGFKCDVDSIDHITLFLGGLAIVYLSIEEYFKKIIELRESK